MREAKAMRVRFAKDKEGNYYQYVVKHEDQDIEFVDFSNGTMEEAEAKMTEWTRVPFKLEDTPADKNRHDQNAGWIQRRLFPGASHDRGRPVIDLFPERYHRAVL